MKTAAVLSFAVLALPALVTAQNSVPALSNSSGSRPVVVTTLDGSQTTVTIVTAPSCPIAMHAKQGSGAGLVMVRKQKPDEKDGGAWPAPKPGQQIHLILGKMSGGQFSDPSRIAGATVTVKGLSARDRARPAADPSGNSPSDLRRTMNVTFVIENDGTISADLNLPGFTSVNSVKLDSVALKDGSTWTLDDLKTCVVTPDRMMLIANQ